MKIRKQNANQHGLGHMRARCFVDARRGMQYRAGYLEKEEVGNRGLGPDERGYPHRTEHIIGAPITQHGNL